jgi:hypothetical protein
MTSAPINSKQRIVLLVGGLLLSAMLLFPPWIWRGASPGSGYNQRVQGYAFIFIPPKDANQIDTTRLFIQFLAVTLALGGVYVYLKDRS